MASPAGRLRQMEQCVPSLPTLDRDGRVRRDARNSLRIGGTRTTCRYGGFDNHPGASLRGRHKKGTQDQEALGRSRGGFTTKIHARCDGKGRPLGFTLTPGQAHDINGFLTLLRMMDDKIDALLGDKGYDSDHIIAAIEEMGIEAVIPSKSNARSLAPSIARPTSSATTLSGCLTSSRTGAVSPRATIKPQLRS